MLQRIALALAVLLAATHAQAALLASDAPIAGDYTLGPTTPGKWGSPTMGTGATVTWSIMGPEIDLGPGHSAFSVDLDLLFPTGWHAQVVAAFAAWSAVADITFIEVTDSGAPWNSGGAFGDIRIGAAPIDGPGLTLAHGYFPPANGNTAAGDIHFDSGETWKIGFGGLGFDIFQVLAHEIGHAIGLDHSDVPGSLMNPFYTEAFVGLQADDIAGAIFLYGAAQTTNGPAVPEPSTVVLLLCGGGLVGGVVVRRRRLAA